MNRFINSLPVLAMLLGVLGLFWWCLHSSAKANMEQWQRRQAWEKENQQIRLRYIFLKLSLLNERRSGIALQELGALRDAGPDGFDALVDQFIVVTQKAGEEARNARTGDRHGNS